MKVGRRVSALVLGLVLFAMACSSAGAAPGDLDRFFGHEGMVGLEDPVAAGFVSAADMAVGSDDKIYVLRAELRCPRSECTVDLSVVRHIPDGSRDTSFGVSGVGNALRIFEAAAPKQGSLAIGPDGKVVVGSTDRGDLVLARLNPDGSLDRTFGVGGVARTNLGVAMARVQIAVQGDGKIVVGTEPRYGYEETAVVVSRYTQQGAVDPTFNGGAPVLAGLGSGLGGFDLAGDTGIVIAGPRCCDVVDRAIHVARLDASGFFDRRFGNRGHRFVDDVAQGAEVGAVVTLPDGKIDIVGSGGHNGDIFALRLLSNGRLDRAFGDHGIVYVKRANFNVAGAAVDGRGRLVIAGVTPSIASEGTSLTVLRRQADGHPDRTFGGGSLVRLPSLSETEAQVQEVGLQSGGRIVVLAAVGSCQRSCPPPKPMLVRYLGGSGGASCLGRKATILGTRNAETLTGTPNRDVIAALSGNDVVRGRGGNDLICGGRGNDRLIGGPGKDRLAGGPGSDRVRR